MRQKYCDWEHVFEFIWKHADRDGFWDGSATTLATVFRASEDETRSALGDLADRGLIEHVFPGTYAISEWREKDETADDLWT